MNHHADKLSPSEAPQDGRDVYRDAIVLEVHSCASCGAVATRLSAE